MGHCRITDLRCKEVINICDGCRLGFPCDVVVDVVTGQLIAIVVPGPGQFFGLFGKSEDIVIGWECIKRIGDDIILVHREFPGAPPKRRRWFW